MQVVVISAEESVPYEIETIISLFNGGLERFHVRKPDWQEERLKKWIKQIPEKYYEKIVIHRQLEVAKALQVGGYHLADGEKRPVWQGRLSRSFHTTSQIKELNERLSYGFISPVFKSISKEGYEPAFEMKELESLFATSPSTNIYALGGVTPNKKELLRSVGFHGVAILGAIWREATINDRMNVFFEFSK